MLQKRKTKSSEDFFYDSMTLLNSGWLKREKMSRNRADEILALITSKELHAPYITLVEELYFREGIQMLQQGR